MRISDSLEYINKTLPGLENCTQWAEIHDEMLTKLQDLLSSTDLSSPARHLCKASEQAFLAVKQLTTLDAIHNKNLINNLSCLLKSFGIDIPGPITNKPNQVSQETVLNAINQLVIVSTADIDGNITYTNDRFQKISGYQEHELLGQNHRLIKSDAHPPEFYEHLWDTIISGQTWHGELCNKRKDGSKYWVSAIIQPVLDEAGNPVQFISVRTDITHVKELELEALDASKAKTEFLSSMSHELRTPMNSILGFAQILEYDDALNEDQQDSVHEIARAGSHLLDLINEVLDLARIESGRIDMSIEPVSLGSLVNECEDLISPIASNKSIELDLSLNKPFAVLADRVRLKQILLNLLSNAIKYNRHKGSVQLFVEERPLQRLRINLKDTGPGIPASKQHMLFRPFNRLGAENSTEEGTGIGLSIARTLVELMDGEIGFSSETDQGSTFWIELPQLEADTSDNNESDLILPYEAPEEAGESQQLVLYIEDNPANLRLVGQILAKRSHIRLLTAHEPELGLELAATHVPKLILLDINMPRLNGYQVLERLRADPELEHIPVIALTASAMPQDIERGRQAGFNDYLTKPLNIAQLLSIVDELKPQ